MLAKPRALRVIKWPTRGDIELGVRLLTERELDLCRIEAQRGFRKHFEAIRVDPNSAIDVDPEMLERQIRREIIARAYYDAETINAAEPTPFFPSASAVAELDSVAADELFRMYVEHQDYVNPSVTLTEDEAKELIATLGKEQEARAIFSLFAPDTLVSLLHSLACRLSTSPPGRSDGG